MFTLKSFSRRARPCASSLALAAALTFLSLFPLSASAQGLEPAATSEALVSRAQAQGQIRVIVGLDMPAMPEGGLTEQAIGAQRAAISAAQDGVLGALGSPEAVRFETIPYVSLMATPDQLETLLATPGVTSVVEDIPLPPNLTDSTRVIRARAVWSAGVFGTGWNVAVLDTGINYDHRAFWGAITASACFSSNVSSDGVTSLCRGGVTREMHRRAAPSCDTAILGCGHGTHVAGIAAGHRPSWLRGVAPEAGIIPIQVFSRFPATSSGCDDHNPDTPPRDCVLSFQTDQIAALERVSIMARRRPIAAVNMSLGGGYYTATCDGVYAAYTAVVNNLRSLGVAVVASSGNSGRTTGVGFPACISNVIAVGATDNADTVASFSNQADGLTELMAPGVSIRAPYEGGQRASARLSGTSMAAPHVAGAFALMREVAPSATVDEILAALVCTGIPVTRSNTVGTFPRINVRMARAELRFSSRCR